MPKIIEVIVDREGNSDLETKGFKGRDACKTASKAIEDALGTKTSDELTGEAFAEPDIEEHEHERE